MPSIVPTSAGSATGIWAAAPAVHSKATMSERGARGRRGMEGIRSARRGAGAATSRLEATLLLQNGQALGAERDQRLEDALHPDGRSGAGWAGRFAHDRQRAGRILHLVATPAEESGRF